MADEPIKPNSPVDTAALMAEVESLRKSKAELLDDYKKALYFAEKLEVDDFSSINLTKKLISLESELINYRS